MPALSRIVFIAATVLCVVVGLAFAEEDSTRQADFDLKSHQPIMSPPGCPIGPIMPAGRPQQYAIEEVSTGHSPKSCSIKDFLFPWTRESD